MFFSSMIDTKPLETQVLYLHKTNFWLCPWKQFVT